MSQVAFITDAEMLHHETGPGHPERPARLEAILKQMDTPAWRKRLDWSTPQPASLEWLHGVHDPAYVRMVEEACLAGQHALDAGDTQVSHDSYQAARLSAGAALAAVDAVAGGARAAFAAGRPPGHHACESRAMGFCLFGNAAIAARYAQQKHNLERIFILDWDVHHGNGTQDMFYEDPHVLFASLHQYPFFPGTGSAEETGAGPGKGYTLNCPLRAWSAWPDFDRSLNEHILPRAQEYQPDLILVSAGYDAHRQDPLGQIHLETEDFSRMSLMVKSLAQEVCQGRLVCLLEGGYDLEALADSVEATVDALCEHG